MKKNNEGTCDPVKTHGGARKNAGRKKKPTRYHLVRLTDEQHKKLKELGGSRWLQSFMNYMIERDKLAKEKLAKVINDSL